MMFLQKSWDRWKHTLYIRAWSLWKVPLINMMRPQVLHLDDERCSILIPLHYWTKNHFRSMYISSQVTGADLGAGLLAQHHIDKSGKKLSILFKDLHADFKKRPDADTVFTCTEGREIAELIQKALLSGQREQKSISVYAQCPEKYGDSILSEFRLTLSVKKAKS